jgi:hypothetical protein
MKNRSKTQKRSSNKTEEMIEKAIQKAMSSNSKNDKDKAKSVLRDSVRYINESKIFAGVMVIILNVSTKFVPMKISKSMEAFLRHTFSRNLLVFAICWVGTRDILISLCITAIFILLMDFLLNEESYFCILPESFTNYHLSLIEQDENNK